MSAREDEIRERAASGKRGVHEDWQAHNDRWFLLSALDEVRAERDAEHEKQEWWRDMMSSLTALVDAHFTLGEFVSHEERLRQVRTELHDMGAEWDTEWRSDNQRLAERAEKAEGERDRAVELLAEADGMLFNYHSSYDPRPWRDEYRAFLAPLPVPTEGETE
jgi:hypothetical protein